MGREKGWIDGRRGREGSGRKVNGVGDTEGVIMRKGTDRNAKER